MGRSIGLGSALNTASSDAWWSNVKVTAQNVVGQKEKTNWSMGPRTGDPTALKKMLVVEMSKVPFPLGKFKWME